METDTVPSQEPKCPVLWWPQLKVDPNEENGSETIRSCEDEKFVDLDLKCNEEESSSDDKLIVSTHIGKFKIKKEELDQKEFDIYLKEPSYIKYETGTFEKIQAKSNDRNIDNNAMEPYVIKKETSDVNKVAAKELNYSHESHFKLESIEQEELYIKEEEDIDDCQNKKILKLNKQSMLHRCQECPYSTNRKGDLEAHSIRHKKKDEIVWYSCPECPHKTYRERYLLRHTEIHNKLILKCSTCSYETLRSSKFKKHQIEHKPNIQWLHCPECSFKTHQQSYFQKHSLAHKLNVFKCIKCSYQAKTKYQLTKHQLKHESMDRWHSCPVCPYKTYCKNELKRHCQQCHSCDPSNPKQIKIFKCTECSYENGYKANIRKHQLIHDRRNWFQCPDCPYKNPYKFNLKTHQIRHQEGNAEGWHKCLECSYKTPYKHDLRKHFISHKSAEEIRLFECLKCSFKTARKESLRRHQVQHKEAHEIEWFYCHQCSFKTKQKCYLVTHMLKHKKQIDKGYLQNRS